MSHAEPDQPSLERLGAYVLPGRVSDPRPAIGQARAAAAAGLGAIWLSERWGSKDHAAILGALSQVAPGARLAAGTTHFLTRHPLVLASSAMTLQALADGRFVLGIGRATTKIGLPRATNAMLIETLGMVRRLWNGESVSYDGPAGTFPMMRMTDIPPVEPPRVVLAAIGPRAQALAGQHFDGVLLHPFLTVDAVGRAAAAVRSAAERAGRDPLQVRVYVTVVTAPDLPPEEEEAVVGGRAVTYFQIRGVGERLAEANGWDVQALSRLRDQPQLAHLLPGGTADQAFTRRELSEVSRVLPRSWLASGAAIGTARQCAERLRDYLDAGADEVVIHGSTPDQLGPTVAQFNAAGRGRPPRNSPQKS